MTNAKLVKRKRKSLDKFKIRKISFWAALILLLIIALIYFLHSTKSEVQHRLIRVGICGAVHIPAVYTMREGSDLGMLVRKANGFRANADVSKVNLDFIVQHDSIYHIPANGGSGNELRLSYELMSEVNRYTKASYTDLTQEVAREFKDKEIKKYSILYVGLPAVYVLINYYPEFNRINFIHLPHSTLFLNNEYRLIDIFFMLDIYPTMRILEHTLKQKIDFYLIQDRGKFIDLIDMLGGVELNLDASYAETYNLNTGRGVVDGFHTWEYIRFLDWRNIEMTVKSEKKKDLIREDNFQVAPGTWERIYEIRNQRQRYVLQGMRKSFKALSRNEQLNVIENFKNVFQTDMTVEFLMDLYEDILTTKDFNFGNIPGYYSREGMKLFFYPDLPNYEMLQRQEIRRCLEKRQGRTQIIY